jgi:succinate dehydrogenase/fumarate reductase flavoprotein subunit
MNVPRRTLLEDDAAVTMKKSSGGFDAIVIGSGIGGLACACALTRSGLEMLVLERHSTAGGLTQTFSRKGFNWAVGLHYLGEMREGGSARRSVTGLYLTGQDVGSAGITGAMMGGMLAAVAFNPKLLPKIG